MRCQRAGIGTYDVNLRLLLYGFGLSWLALNSSALANDEGFWISDANGCKVVASAKPPQPKLTMTWSGACPNGFAQGRGTVESFVDGKKVITYQISILNGKPNGEGSYTTANGAHFQGTFVDGKASGKGEMTWPNGDHYTGDWSDSRRTGRGVLTRPNGDRYEGDFVKDNWSGTGILTTTNGDRYDGAWLDNKRVGQGVQISADGSRYDGEWKDDKAEGAGEMKWPDGSHYKGVFVDNKPANPELVVRQHYDVKQYETGSRIAHDSITGSPVPPNKSYAGLTAEQKKSVKLQFGLTHEGDEPPYPRYGPLAIYEALKSIEQRFQARGLLSLSVTVGPDGKPLAVDVSQSPDKRITQAITDFLMLQRFKAAMCNAAPCKMQYPLVVNLQTE